MTELLDPSPYMVDGKMNWEAAKKAAQEKGLWKPGGFVPFKGYESQWVAWTKDDLDPNETVQFIAQNPLGTQGGVLYGEKGRTGMVLDVNGLTCAITFYQLNEINKFFYSRYEAMINDNIRLEEFKQGGPGKGKAPWTNWYYTGTA